MACNRMQCAVDPGRRPACAALRRALPWAGMNQAFGLNASVPTPGLASGRGPSGVYMGLTYETSRNPRKPQGLKNLVMRPLAGRRATDKTNSRARKKDHEHHHDNTDREKGSRAIRTEFQGTAGAICQIPGDPLAGPGAGGERGPAYLSSGGLLAQRGEPHAQSHVTPPGPAVDRGPAGPAPTARCGI